MSDQNNSQQYCRSPPCADPPNLQLYQAIIFATPVLFAAMVILIFCLLYLRRHGGANINSQMRGQFFGENLTDLSSVEQGLRESFRQRLPITFYNQTISVTWKETQCAVCLGDYQLNEKLIQLPLCNHSFHMQCIDEWLSKNVTCPICRSCLTQEGNAVDEECQNVICPDNNETSTRGNENRLWEGRVVNRAQEQGFITGMNNYTTTMAGSSTGQLSQTFLSMERS